jgi:hypothetical protein
MLLDRCDDSWTTRAIPLDHPKISVFFLTETTFLTGDPNTPAHFDDPAHNVAIESAFADGFLRLSDFAEEKGRLVAYYREVATLATRHGKGFNDISYHFWMRMTIGCDGAGLGFPWYSHWSEFERLLAFIETATEGERFEDIDQGWDLEILRGADGFFARETDTEGEEYANLRLPAAALIAAAKAARRDGTAAIAVLTAQLGPDLWTRYTYQPETVTFGTPEWTPAP